MKKILKNKKQKWKRRDQIMLFERLSMYLGAGLSIDKALLTAKSGLNNIKQKNIENISSEINKGRSLSQTLKENIFIKDTIIGLIEHGESSGQLAKSFGLAQNIVEKEDVLIKTCLSAMTYPFVIALFALFLTIGLMKFVMPQIIPLLKSLHVQLPLLTQIVIFISENISKFGLYILIGTIFLSVSMLALYRKIIYVKKIIQNIILHLPLINKIIIYYAYSIILRSLGMLIDSGAPLTISYEKVVHSVSIIPLKNSLLKKVVSLSDGNYLGSIFLEIKYLPAYISALVSTGENSGNLANSLIRSSDILDRDIENILKRLTALVEPVMMIFLGCGIGSIALSIMMPIYDVSKALQH